MVTFQLHLCGVAHYLYRSVRIPAAFCGLVGMKATWGTVPYSGILGLHADIDHCGPMTKTVRDNALMLQAIAGPDGMDDRQPTLISPEALKYTKHLDAFLTETAALAKPLNGFRIGVLQEGFAMPQLNPAIEKAVRSAIADPVFANLKAAGPQVFNNMKFRSINERISPVAPDTYAVQVFWT